MNNSYEKNINYIIEILNNINVEIIKLYKKISTSENINNVKNNDEYFYKIDNFGIPYIDHILLNKNYYYIKADSKIDIKFSCDFIRNETLYDNVKFRVNILDDNYDILCSKEININSNDHINFEMNLNIDKDIINPIIKIIIFRKNNIYINDGKMFIDGHFFKIVNHM